MANVSDKLFSQSDFQIYTRKLYPAVYFTNNEKKFPTCWSNTDKSLSLLLSELGLSVTYRETNGNSENISATVRSNNSIPFVAGVYYFEIVIDSKGKQGHIGIGVALSSAHLDKLPGWEPTSFGYHGDDGDIFHESGHGSKYGPQFTEGDTVGCGVDFVNGSIFFTKNGVFLGSAFDKCLNGKRLFPCVGLQSSNEKVSVNFGQKPFVYQIENHIEKVRDEYQKRLAEKHSIDKLQHVTMKALVASYLVHHGYVHTAESFSRWSGHRVDEEIESIKFRKEIQRLILEGHIESAIDKIDTVYPAVFADNPDLRFQLKCRQFIEMVCHQFSNMTRPPTASTSNGDLSSDVSSSSAACRPATNGTSCAATSLEESNNLSTAVQLKLNQHSLSGQQVVLGSGEDGDCSVLQAVSCPLAAASAPVHLDDVEMLEISSVLSPPTSAKNGHCCTLSDTAMEVSPLAAEGDTAASATSSEGLNQLIAFGRYLKDLDSELKRDNKLSSESAKLLSNAFSLVAYNDPLKSPLCHLLHDKCKEQTANSVNSAILVSQNLPKRPTLELAVQQLDDWLAHSLKGNVSLAAFIHPRSFLDSGPS